MNLKENLNNENIFGKLDSEELLFENTKIEHLENQNIHNLIKEPLLNINKSSKFF